MMLSRLAAAPSLLSLALLLAGCSTSFAPTATPYVTNVGIISGQVHGGRGPIVGAHIFLFAAGTGGDAGPGIAASTSNKSTSLLTSSSASGYTTAMDTTGTALSNPTYGDYYVTTDANGGFAVGGEYTCTQGTQIYLYSVGGNPGGSSANSAAGLMAVLGQCPASGTMAALTPTVYMNEVSTVAAAYAFAGYATDATHVSSKGTPLALTGIANAFANASMLYDISGATNQATANIVIPRNTANSVIGYQAINSLGNSLAACVNSSGPSSAQCSSGLFGAVKSAGATGNTATDTATEAIYIAHNPGTNVGTIFNNTTGIGTPFQTALTSAPNDWTIGVSLSNATQSPNQIAFDSAGNAWIFGYGITAFTPQGALLFADGGFTSNEVRGAVDNAGFVWVSNYSNSSIYRYWGANAVAPNTPGTVVGTYTAVNGLLWLAIDANGDIWAPAYTHGTDIYVYYGSNAASPHNPGDLLTSLVYHPGESIGGAREVMIDTNGYAWVGGTDGVSEYCATKSGCALGTAITSAPVAGSSEGFFAPTALDAAGNMWGNKLGTVNTLANVYGSNAVTPNQPGDLVGSYTGGGLDDPGGIAIDGSGNVWASSDDPTKISDGDQGSVSEFTGSGTAISPSSGYTSSNRAFFTINGYVLPAITGGAAIAVDGSGNVWISNTENIEILIGAATPVATPIGANLSAPYGTANVNRP